MFFENNLIYKEIFISWIKGDISNMIQTKSDLKYFIESDLKSLGCYPLTLKLRLGGGMSINLEVSNKTSETGVCL